MREEYNLPLTKESYLHLREKADGVLISKTRYLLPLTGTDLTIELDVFDAPYEGLYLCLLYTSIPADPPDTFPH